MPKPYGARSEEIQRDSRGILPRFVNLDVCRIELGPSRRDPQGTLQNRSGDTNNVLQGASAMGSFAVTRCVEETVAVSRRDFGVRVATRSAHANRACLQSARILNAVCKHASNHQGSFASRRCSLQNGLSGLSSTVPRGTRMTTTIIESLETVSLEDALAYLDTAEGDELEAAFALAKDRNLLDGSKSEPDEAEVHHALFLLRRARGLTAPSFDLMRVQLRQRVAA